MTREQKVRLRDAALKDGRWAALGANERHLAGTCVAAAKDGRSVKITAADGTSRMLDGWGVFDWLLKIDTPEAREAEQFMRGVFQRSRP